MRSLLLVIVVLLLVVSLTKGQLDSFNYRKVSKNREAVLAPTINKTVDSMVTCAQMCSERKKCVSLSFNSISKECKLYIHYITDTTTTIEKKGEIILSLNYMIGRREVNIVSVNSSSHEPGCSPVNVLDNDPTSCLITELPDTEPWLLVDLGHVTTVSDVVVHTSEDVTVQHKFHDVNFELYSVDPRLNPGVEGLCCGSTEGLSASRIVIVRCSCNVAGRYLKIYVEKSEKLTICYVEVLTRTDISGCVYGEAAKCKKLPRGPNLAKDFVETLQSMVYVGDSSKLAVDDDRSTCITVHATRKNWWYIVLNGRFNITSITIANILNKEWVDLKNLEILYEDKTSRTAYSTTKMCTFIEGYIGATTRTFQCDKPVVTHQIRIETPEKSLRFCNLEITGDLVRW